LSLFLFLFSFLFSFLLLFFSLNTHYVCMYFRTASFCDSCMQSMRASMRMGRCSTGGGTGPWRWCGTRKGTCQLCLSLVMSRMREGRVTCGVQSPITLFTPACSDVGP
jgi:hypothetical protein